MQAYANVGTAPTRHTAKTSGKAYWEFRASESARGEDKNPTWYAGRSVKDEDRQLKKGDFVVFTGKLKNDIFMGRDGKPIGVLTVLAFNLQKVAKDGKRETVVDAPQAVENTATATTAPAKETIAEPPLAAQTPVAASSKSPAPPKPLFGGLGQWGLTPQTVRFGM
mgnify:CR=1 FL=1